MNRFKLSQWHVALMGIMTLHALPPTQLAEGYTDEGSFGLAVTDLLLAGESKVVTRDDIIATGQGVILKGTVLARQTANGKLYKHTPATSDGVQVACAIASSTVDTTSADQAQAVYVGGVFNRLALVWNAATNTKALQRAAFGENKTILIDEVTPV